MLFWAQTHVGSKTLKLMKSIKTASAQKKFLLKIFFILMVPGTFSENLQTS